MSQTICGEFGHKNKMGGPCGQPVRMGEKACLWHGRTPEERSALAAKGGHNKRMKLALPDSYTVDLSSREACLGLLRDLTHKALTATVDARRIETALKGVKLALDAHGQGDAARLYDAVMRMEHGGAAVALLERLQDGMTSRRPLPGRRILAIANPEGGGA